MDKPLSYGHARGQEVSGQSYYEDARTPRQKRREMMRRNGFFPIAVLVCALICLFFPGVQELGLITGFVFASMGYRQERSYPLQAPVMYQDESPREVPAQGIFYMGQEKGTGRQIWLSNSEMRQHLMVLGTTGAGKTETLVSFVANALTWSSGFLYCDGKGDIAVYAKLYALARRFGREDDFLVINFMNAEKRSDLEIAAGKISNTTNPFANGSSSDLTNLVVSLMDGGGGGSDGMWRGRAQAMFSGVMKALTWLRDEGIVDMSVGTIRDHLSFVKIYDLAFDDTYANMPPQIRKSVRAYVESLPGFVPKNGANQQGTTLDQHGFLEMQFTRIMSSLVDEYGYIFFKKGAEVDLKDVVLNRRILVIMLPALQKSADEIANIGKIIVGNLKQMMASQLGSSVQGSVEDLVLNRATNSDSPFVVVLDEAGYYTVDGMALMTAQARSLGFAIIVSSQDVPAMLKLSETEAKSMMGNTNTKVFMRIEDMDSTMDLVVKAGGKGFVTRLGGYDIDTSSFIKKVRKQQSINVQEVDRISPLQIKGQSEGEFHLVHKQHVIAGDCFYADPQKSYKSFSALKLKANHFILIKRPQVGEVEREESTLQLVDMLMSDVDAKRLSDQGAKMRNAVPEAARSHSEIAVFAKGFVDYLALNKAAGETQAACAALANVARVASGLSDGMAGTKAPKSFEDLRSMNASDPFVVEEEVKDPYAEIVSFDDAGAPSIRQEAIEQEAVLASWQEEEVTGVPGYDTKPAGENRRPANVDKDVPHDVNIGGRRLDDVAESFAENDASLRTLVALSYDPDHTTAQEVDQGLHNALGSRSDPTYADVADSSELDEVVHRSEKLRGEVKPASPPDKRDDEAAGNAAGDANGQSDVYLAELWDTIMEESTN